MDSFMRQRHQKAEVAAGHVVGSGDGKRDIPLVGSPLVMVRSLPRNILVTQVTQTTFAVPKALLAMRKP